MAAIGLRIFILVICYLAQAGNAKLQPNFIIMLMDDMGFGDLGVLGQLAKDTPNLDKMAAEGMVLTDFYSANPLCSPSRAALLTGRLPIRNGFYTSSGRAINTYAHQQMIGGISDYEILLPELLAKAGYRNKIIGKWHLGHRAPYHPMRHGFHEFFGSTNCHLGPYDDKLVPNMPVFKDEEMSGRYYDDYIINTVTGESNLTQLYIQEALEFIERASKQKTPFLLYWSPDATHTPVYASKQFLGTSRRGLYGDAVRELDFGVGQILQMLRRQGIDRNTLVFFSSDNGAALYAKNSGGSNGPFLCGKLTTFEGGMREPAIAWYPGTIKPGQVSYQLGTLMDLFPTMLDLSGVEKPNDRELDGRSLRSFFINGTKFERNIFYYRGNELMAVRVGMYKAHLCTWTNLLDEFETGYDYCPGQDVRGITTHDFTDHTDSPILFHLGRDPGEKYPIVKTTEEYHFVIPNIVNIIADHKKSMIPGKPEMDWCDPAVQHWAPPGCQRLKKCLPIPPSMPYRCQWSF